MKLFLKLLSLRIRSVFFGSGAKSEKKNIGFKIFIGIMIAYAAICFIAVFGVYFARLANSFVEQDCGWAYFSMVGMIMIAIGFVTTVFAAQSQIFEAKDNELLTAMPIPVRYILVSRIITLLLIELMESIILGIEAAIVYSFFTKLPIGGYFFMIVEIIGINLVTATISSLFGWILAFITSKVHRKALVTTVATLIIAAGFFSVIRKGEYYLNEMLNSDKSIENAMRTKFYPFYCFGKGIGECKIKEFLLVMLMCIAIFVAMVFLLSPFFLKITSTKKGNYRKKYSPEHNKERSIETALFLKEIKRFFTNASYMLNTGMGLLILFVAGIVLIVEKNKLFDMITSFPYMRQHMGVFVLFIELFFCAINVISAPSISLEGDSLWICKSMPIKPVDILMAKAKAHIIICMPFMIFFGIAASISIEMSPIINAALFLIPMASTVFTGLLGVIDNLMLPKFDWTDDSIAVKQSMAVIATMGIGFGIVIVSFFAYAIVHMLPYADGIFVTLFFIAYVVAIILMINYLKKGGSKRFIEL